MRRVRMSLRSAQVSFRDSKPRSHFSTLDGSPFGPGREIAYPAYESGTAAAKM